jgi:uncharacterized protein (UPF0276 family)
MDAFVPPRALATPVPASAGIGLRSAHQREFLEGHPPAAWLEVHSENYFARGGAGHAMLTRIRRDYPVSFHGVGLSLGSTDPLDRRHLHRLREIVDRYEPALVSEHLSWSSVGGRYLNDLLPLPATREALELVVLHVDETQESLGRPILLENVSSYMRFGASEMPEACFMVEVAQRTGCRILLDVNNLYVNERNHGTSAAAFIDAVPAELVGEIHLAGHSVQEYEGEEIVVDTHNARVCAAVWNLYADAIGRIGRVPTLIEWDSELPPLSVLLDEANHADRIMGTSHELAA